MPRRTDFRNKPGKSRKAPSRPLRRHILIVCEGAKTEVNYFEEIRKSLRLSAMEIDIQGLGQDPKSLVERAKQLRHENSEENPYESVWCVFDRDEHPSWKAAIDMARANSISVACSNPCFELWYLLHHDSQRTWLDRREALRRVARYYPGYEKGCSGMYARLLHLLPQAMDNARFLRERHHPDAGNPEYANPWTNVDQLVSELMTGQQRQ